jgi:hypothetical protein
MASRTPPERFASAPAPLSSPDHHSRTDSSASSKEHHAIHNELDNLHIVERSAAVDDEEESVTPIKPSAKALGKRRVIDAEKADCTLFPDITDRITVNAVYYRPDDIFYDNRDDPYPVENRLDSDSDEFTTGRWQQHVMYMMPPPNVLSNASDEVRSARLSMACISQLDLHFIWLWLSTVKDSWICILFM